MFHSRRLVGCQFEVIDHGRAVKHRLLEISRAAKSLAKAGRQRLRDSYAKLVALTRRVAGQASEVVRRLNRGRLQVVGDPLQVHAQAGLLQHDPGLVDLTQGEPHVGLAEHESHREAGI